MLLGPFQVTLGWKCGNGKGQRHYQFNLWFAMTTDQDHLMAWLPFCLSRLDWFVKANPCNHSCQSWTFCVDSPPFQTFQTFQTCQYISLLKNKQHNLKTICHWVNLDTNHEGNIWAGITAKVIIFAKQLLTGFHSKREDCVLMLYLGQFSAYWGVPHTVSRQFALYNIWEGNSFQVFTSTKMGKKWQALG